MGTSVIAAGKAVEGLQRLIPRRRRSEAPGKAFRQLQTHVAGSSSQMGSILSHRLMDVNELGPWEEEIGSGTWVSWWELQPL
jgi:hypothetical protein